MSLIFITEARTCVRVNETSREPLAVPDMAKYILSRMLSLMKSLADNYRGCQSILIDPPRSATVFPDAGWGMGTGRTEALIPFGNGLASSPPAFEQRISSIPRRQSSTDGTRMREGRFREARIHPFPPLSMVSTPAIRFTQTFARTRPTLPLREILACPTPAFP